MPTEQVTLSITGMHCTSCAQLIAQSLQETEGIQEATVDFKTGKAQVRYDADATNAQELLNVVEEAGYSATIAKQ